MPDRPRRDPRSGEDWHRQLMSVLPGLLAAIFLAALDQSVMSTSIKTIADDLGGLSLQAWPTTAFLITSTVSTPLYGKLSDMYGRRPLFAIAIGVFVLGSLCCASAQSIYQLAAFRGLQGLGGGGLLSIASAITADLVPPRERSRYQGYTMSCWIAASLLGPIIGGLFASAHSVLGVAGWRWVFLVNAPVGGTALIVVSRVLRPTGQRRARRIDHWGATAISVAAVPLLLVAEQGNRSGWTSPTALACYTVGALGVVAFLLAERRMGDDALIPLRLFRVATFSLAITISALVGLGMFGVISTVPLYLQVVHGLTPTAAGLMMLPMMAGTLASVILSGKLIKRGGGLRILPATGSTIIALAMFCCCLVTVDTPLWALGLIMVAFGIGIGSCRTVNVTAQNAVPPRDVGVATASVVFFREMAGAIGVAGYLSVLFGALPARLATAVGDAASRPEVSAALADRAVAGNPANAPFFAVLRGGREALADWSFLPAMDPRLARAFQLGFDSAIGRVFLVGGLVMCVAALLALCMKPPELRTVGAAQAEEYFGRHRAPESA
ncbi:MFS transporter [Planosporangium thailandense]|uniref:MFS transporter n=2 Tax=Planosporangium thailandense TaxID=765197 RepID=A0ABX0XZ58_9ACTN|nr:MFS transporter [Planosporangium thailandense]